MRGKCERGHPFSTPGLRFHGVDRADVYYNICVRASRCGECALNSPTSQHLPRRPPSPAPAQRHALPEHFRSPTQRRCTPAGYATHSSPPSQPIPRRRPSPVPAQRHALPEHSRSPTQRRCTPSGCAIHAPPPSQLIPHRRPSPVPAQRHALPEHFHSPTQRRPVPPSVPLRAQKTAPHSECAMPNVSVDRRAVGHWGW